jgi:hypothetical protein
MRCAKRWNSQKVLISGRGTGAGWGAAVGVRAVVSVAMSVVMSWFVAIGRPPWWAKLRRLMPSPRRGWRPR